MKRLLTLAIAAIVVFPFLAFGQSEGYYDRSFIRLSYVQGDVYIQRAQDQGFEKGEVNLVVVAGDKLGTRDGRAEIQLGRGNVLRLDQNTQVDIVGLPARDGDPTKIHLLNGSIFLRVREVDQEKNLQIHTPDASFYVLEAGLFRVDVVDNRQTEFSALSGQAEAAGEEGSVAVRAGESVTALDGRLNGEPTELLARRDDFGSWNESRDGLYARRASRSYLPEQYAEYDSELSEYGDWSYESEYGNVWVPRVSDEGWRPYYNGRWSWYPIIGWTWVSYEPWGWCTSHYGRWGWRGGLGWYWIPMNRWSWGPAWVNWYGYGDYLGWCPLSYWGYPAMIYNNRFYGRNHGGWYEGRNFRDYGRSLTVVRRDQMQNRGISRIAVDHRNDLGRLSLRAAQPNLRPSIDRNSGVANRAREVLNRGAVRSVGRDFSSLNGRRPSSEARPSTIRKAGSGDLSRNGATVNRGRDTRSTSRSISERAIRPQTGTRSIGVTQSGSSRLPERGTMRVYPSRSQDGRTNVETKSSRVKSGTTPALRNSNPTRTIREREGLSQPTRGTSSRSSAPSIRSYPGTRRSSSDSGRSVNTPSRSSSSYRTYGVPSEDRTRLESRSYSSSSRNSSSSGSRSYSSPSRRSSSSDRSLRAPSRSYTAPSRSSSSSGSRSYSSPSRSSSSSGSRSYSSPSRSSSSSSRSSGASSRSSSSSSSSRSSSRSSSGSRSSGSGRRR